MLERFAVGLLNRSEGELVAVALLMIVVGFIFALLFRRGGTFSMRRVPYFIWTSAVFGLVSALPLAWLLTIEAATIGVLWMLVALVFGGVFGGGVAYGALGHARSVDAYGDGRNAWMALVPIANLVLLFRRPLDWKEGSWGRLGLNILGVVFGLFLMVLGSGIGEVAEHETEAMARRAETDPAMQRAGIDVMLRSQGLETTLRLMAAEVASQRVDETTTLLRVEGSGTTLRYVYEVSTDAAELPASMRTGLIEQNCAYEAFRPLIEAGATLEHVYQRRNGSEMGRVAVSRQLCGY